MITITWKCQSNKRKRLSWIKNFFFTDSMEQSSNKTSEASMLIYGVLARKKNTTHSVKEKEHRKKWDSILITNESIRSSFFFYWKRSTDIWTMSIEPNKKEKKYKERSNLYAAEQTNEKKVNNNNNKNDNTKRWSLMDEGYFDHTPHAQTQQPYIF